MKIFERAASLAVVFAFGAPMFGATIGQIDTFQNGTTNNWFAGGITGNTPPTPPTVAATGGPGGAGDAYLVVTANGSNGPGGKLVAINAAQWAGNYLAPGIQGIALDLKNLGNTALTIRLLFEDPMGAPPVDEAVTNLGINLAPGSGWTHAFFPILPAGLTAVSGSPSAVLANTTFFRIIDAPTAGDAVPVVGSLGVDNVRLVGTPEPATLLLVAGGLGVLGLFRFRRR